VKKTSRIAIAATNLAAVKVSAANAFNITGARRSSLPASSLMMSKKPMTVL